MQCNVGERRRREEEERIKIKENKSVTTCAAMEIGDVYWLLATHQDTPNLLISRKNFCQLSEREREREREV